MGKNDMHAKKCLIRVISTCIGFNRRLYNEIATKMDNNRSTISAGNVKTQVEILCRQSALGTAKHRKALMMEMLTAKTSMVSASACVAMAMKS